MKSKLAVALDDIQAAMRPFLAEHGFRMRNRGFNRTTDDGLTHVIEIQMGRFEPPGSVEVPGLRSNLYGKFTINLGIYVPEFAEASQMPARGFVREPACAIRVRIGELAPDGRDVWWDIDNAQSPVLDEVRKRLDHHALPFLAKFGSREAILLESRAASYQAPGFSPRQRMVCATILLRRGASTEARELLLEHLEKGLYHPNHVPYIHTFAERVGISLAPLEPSA